MTQFNQNPDERKKYLTKKAKTGENFPLFLLFEK